MKQSYKIPIHHLLNENELSFFNDMAKGYRKQELDYYKNIINGETRASMKQAFCKKHGISSRNYNAIAINSDGKFKAKEKLNEVYLKEQIIRVNSIKESLSDLENKKTVAFKILNEHKKNHGENHKKTLKQAKHYRNIKFKIFHKKRKLKKAELKLEKLENFKISLCFGSKKLFMKQFHLEENNYSKHEEWKKDWQDARNSSFAFIGSKDESYGNQTCQYKNDNDLVIKVPDYLVSKYGAFVTIKNVKFYKLAQKQLDWARKTYMGETKGGRAQKYCNSSISYTFTKQDGKWFIIATVTIELPNTKTSSHYGTLGVDLNAGFLSVCEVDRFGNYLNDKDIIIKMYDRTHNQVKASIGDAVKELVEWALRTKKSICIEDLDFAKLKASLTEKSKKYARMLSGLTYATFKEMLFSKAQKCGVEVILVNPAFTSVTGHFKFMRKYGLSSHASAAMTIARRGMSFKRMEKPVINPDLNGLSPRSDKFKKSSYKIKGAVVSGENRVNGKEKKRQLVIKPQICKKQEETHKTRRQKWQKILNNCKEINFNERIEILKLV